MDDQKRFAPVPGLTEFVNEVLPSKLPMNWHHRLFYDILSNQVIQKDDGKLYLNTTGKINKNILMLAPRFHAKSQCFTINYPLWEIYRNPNIRIIFVSANEDIAVSFNRAIISNLENNEALIERYGYLVPTVPKKWGERAMTVQRTSMEKDPTIAAIGVGGKLISRRADIIIIDDLIDIDSARTKMARNKTREWLENVVFPILEDDGRIVVAGTAWYRDDIYDTLWQESSFDIRLKLKALIYNDKYNNNKGHNTRFLPYKLTDYPHAQKAQDIFSEEVMRRYELWKELKDGVLWKDKWSFEKLMDKKKNMTSTSFMRQYLNEPSTEEEKLFKETLIRRMQERGSTMQFASEWDNINFPVHFPNNHMTVAIGVDLAISKKSTSDNSAIAVWGMDERRDRYCLYLDYGRWSPDEIKQRVLDCYYAFSPVKIRVENVAFQDMLRQELAQDIPVEGFHTTSGKKFNPETGISHIAMLMEQDKLILPSSNASEDTLNKSKQLAYEMSVYSFDQHAGDCLMASWFALDILKEFDKKMKENRGYFTTDALIYQLKNVKAAHKVVLLGHHPPYFKFGSNSLVHIFRPVKDNEQFFTPDEPFMIFASRDDMSLGYIFQKQTNELVGKIEGQLSALMNVTLLEKAGQFFNDAQIVVDRVGEGEAIYLELEKRGYPYLLCLQPGKDALPIVEPGFVSSAATVPLAVDYFRQNVDKLQIIIPDGQLVKEMGELIGVEGDKLKLSFGIGQRIKTFSLALWLLDNYENSEKQFRDPQKSHKSKTFQNPYRIFQK